MSSATHSTTLQALVNQLEEVTQQTRQAFADLSEKQLNWKPAPEQWSVAQCFDHLMTANQPYLGIFRRVSNDEKKNTLWESMPFVPGFFGSLLIKSLDPNSKRKLRAPKAFAPSASTIDGQVIERFIEQQKELARAMASLEGRSLDSIKVTSPALKLITYSLRDACTIIVVHEQRHFQQAERVVASDGFPRNEVSTVTQ